MFKRPAPFLLAPFLALASLTLASPARAQSVVVGNTDAQIISVLEANGYTDAAVTQRGLTIVRAEACKGAEKFQVKVNVLGKITSVTKIGTCQLAQARPQPNRPQRPPNNGSSGGNPSNPGLSGPLADQLTQLLTQQGYSQVAVLDDQLPEYIAEACRREDRVRLSIDRRGQIRSERRIGQCGPSFDPSQLTAYVERRGYDRVKVLRGDRLPFLMEGCRDGALVEVAVDRNGQILKEETVGRCRAQITQEQLNQTLAAEGFFNIEISQANGGWSAKMCRGEEEVTRLVSLSGDTLRERVTGSCRSQTVLEVLRELEARGASTLQLSVTGCYQGTKYRWFFDRLGNRTGRERAGNC